MSSTDEARIFGYAQVSEYEKAKSAEEQAEAIRQKADELDGNWVGCGIDRGRWISEAPYYKRPRFKWVLDKLDPGDCLIVWRLDRIDRNPFRLAKALRSLVNRQARVYVLDFQRMELNIHGPGGEVFVKLMSTIADMFRSQRREAVKRALHWRKESGLPYNRYPPLGRKRIVHNGRKMDAWDERQCALIRQIKAPYDAGESMAEIGRDFYAQRLKTASGVLWAKPYGRKRKLNVNRLCRAYRWYTDLLAQGQDLLGIPAVPMPNPFANPKDLADSRRPHGKDTRTDG